jgi:ABC-type transport system involved in multi-copper enzyme maturation permease subunit
MTIALQAAPPSRNRFRHAAKAELVKILTLRSTAITLGLTVVASLLVTGLATHAALQQQPGYYDGFDPTQQALAGLIAAALTGGVFGALLMTSEYSSGNIRTTLAAVPRRGMLVAAKLCVTALAILAVCEVLSFAAFFLGQAILSGGGAPSASLASPGALRAVTFTGLFISLMTLMSFGFGLIFRSTAAAIAAFVGVVFVLPLVMQGISQEDLRYVPSNMLTQSIMSTVDQGRASIHQPVSPVVGLALMALYAAIVLAAGATLFDRRDA